MWTNTRPHELRCILCFRWLPDHAFQPDTPQPERRDRSFVCTGCSRTVRHDWERREAELGGTPDDVAQ